ncbi:D-tyrosyl-tRNA(Tyr) deacylase [Lacticaseibacillus brantae DSM 23927]|uniref:D-aminoacyl-tRNA deacylase n=1 Tax=Lacticaseibacillus brantae DSM 23927 TaxID=1423727 RepID=A0A0R2B0W6_9LACO|nr:D-tyrosyl-tRNA(Tyr) deacylase [Lacticaseibacillus brantae DSM 23927]
MSQANVKVAGQTIGEIGPGLVALVGIGPNDTPADVTYLAKKVVNARIFGDSNGKMNLSVKDIGGSILSISQFTLFAETKKGNRPSFTHAADPELGLKFYQAFNSELTALGMKVATGEFGADMAVSLVNDGPVTIIYDTEA